MSGQIALEMAWCLVVVAALSVILDITLLLGIREARHKAEDAHRRLDAREDLERLFGPEVKGKEHAG